MIRAYEEIIDFLAAGTTPNDIVAFRPSPETQQRVVVLLEQHSNGELTADEEQELQHYLQLEHLMRLPKARARHHLAASRLSPPYSGVW